MKSALFAALVAIVCSGCVSTQTIPIAAEHEPRVNSKSIGHAHYEKGSFAAMSPGSAAFGMIGAAAAISEGNRIVEEHKVEDPAIEMSAALAGALRQRYKMTQVTVRPVEVKTDDIGQLKSQFNGTDFLLDVRTVNWSYIYYPSNWARYRVIYSAKVRLIDLRAGNVIAEGFCARVPDEVDKAPTSDELLANSAARLKSELQRARDYCLEQFRTTVFRL
jgi:hypothetical protein